MEPGTQVERYVVLETLGVGGMAAVFAAQHIELETRHAIKALTLRSPEIDKRFRQEGKLQAQLRHPNIVSVTDVLTLPGGGPALLMEYISGPPLDALLQRYRPTIDEAVRLTQGIAHGVGYANEKGFVHRDLKPGNVLLALEPEGIRPKVVDFGLAKATEPTVQGMATRTGMTMGTPTFMAPEQTADASAVDQRADVYAIAAILYLLLTGRPPYLAMDLPNIVRAHLGGPPPRPRSLHPGIPEDLDEAIMDGLALKPEDRIPDCRELLRRLGVEEPDLSSTVPPLPGPIFENCKTMENVLAAVDMEGFTLAPPTGDPLMATSQVLSPVTSIAPTAGPRWGLLAAVALVVVAVGAVGLAGMAGLAVLISSRDEPVYVGPIEVPKPLPGRRDTGVAAPPPTAATEPATVAPSQPLQPVRMPSPAHTPPPAVGPSPAPAPHSSATSTAAAPAEPAPATLAPAEPAPAPSQTASPTTSYRLTGDAADAFLTAGGKNYPPGALPAGTYTVRASFGAGYVDAGSVTIGEGTAVTVKCVSQLQQCIAK